MGSAHTMELVAACQQGVLYIRLIVGGSQSAMLDCKAAKVGIDGVAIRWFVWSAFTRQSA